MQSAEQHQTGSTHNQQTSSSSQGKSKNLGILLELIKFIRPYQWKVIAALVALVFTASLTLSVGQGVRLSLIHI